MYAVIKHLSDETYRCSYGAIGFEPTSSKVIESNQALREAVQTLHAAGYKKMPADTPVLITERSEGDGMSFNEWLNVGGHQCR